MGILKDLGKTVYKNIFAGDKFISTFVEASGIHKKPDWTEETAKAMQAQVAMQEWRLTHPGQVPTQTEMSALRGGKQPIEK